MKTITTNLYKFSELSPAGKEAALTTLYDININDEWWTNTYEDAASVDIKITSFDNGGAQSITGELIDTAQTTAIAIIAEHGETCETYKTAKAFLSEWDQLVKDHSDGSNTDVVCEDKELDFDDLADHLESEFVHSILEDYRIMLDKEWDYLSSEEAIIESIEANEYDFTEEGAIY